MIDGGLSSLFQKRMPDFHWQRVETGGCGLGIGDLNFCARRRPSDNEGVEGWIELKKSDAWAVTISAEQVGWAEQRIRAGGRVFLAVRRQAQAGPRRGPKVDSLYIYPGSHTRDVKTMGLRCPLFLLHTPGGPARWDWAAVRAILTGEQ
jgi:hypothetical protein